jgi:hypothetical protein
VKDNGPVAPEAPLTAESNPAAAEPPPTNASTTSASVPGLTSGTGPHGTNGPGDFPTTRENWERVLLRYRQNVLVGLQ